MQRDSTTRGRTYFKTYFPQRTPLPIQEIEDRFLSFSPLSPLPVGETSKIERAILTSAREKMNDTDRCLHVGCAARRGAAAIIHEFSCKKTPPPRQPRCFEYFNSRGRFNFSRFPSQTSRNSIQTNPLPPVVFQRNLNLFQCAR